LAQQYNGRCSHIDRHVRGPYINVLRNTCVVGDLSMIDILVIVVVILVLVVVAFAAIMGILMSIGMVLWMIPRRVGLVILPLIIAATGLIAWHVGWFPAALVFFVGSGAAVTVSRFASFARRRNQFSNRRNHW
jgi:hypothetical protein